MSDISADVPRKDTYTKGNLLKKFIIRIVFPLVVLGSAWYFSDSKLALTNFISDHPSMLLGGLPGLVLVVLLVCYYIILAIESIKVPVSNFWRVFGRILAIIVPIVLFLSILSIFTAIFSDFESDSTKREFLNSFYHYYVTIVLLVILPAEAPTIRRFIEEKIS